MGRLGTVWSSRPGRFPGLSLVGGLCPEAGVVSEKEGLLGRELPGLCQPLRTAFPAGLAQLDFFFLIFIWL